MDFVVPDNVKATLTEFEASKKPFSEYDLSAAIQKAAGPGEKLTRAERRGVWTEIVAFQFMSPSKEPQGPWDSVYAPMASLRSKEGVDIYIPDIGEANEAVIAHWAARSEESKNPILRARYADLVWEFEQLVTKHKPRFEFAQRAIDAYLDAVEAAYYANEVQGANFVGRALSLSSSINDAARGARSKNAAFLLNRSIGRLGKGGMWWVLFDTLYDAKAVKLSEAELTEMIDGLEDVLKSASNSEAKDLFDPWAAQGAAERLERHYRKTQSVKDVRRVAETYGRAFEGVAQQAEPLLAVAWLQPVYEKYRDLGMGEEAKRVHLVLEEKVKAAPTAMKKIEVPINIDPKDLEKYIDVLTDGGLEKAFRKVAIKFIPNAKDIRAFNERMKDVAPLASRIPMRLFEHDHVAAIVGGQDDDPDGRLIHQMANHISFDVPWLAMALDKIKDRYQVTPEKFLEFVSSSPLIDESRKAILGEGIAAALANDPVKAIHVLVPQIEHIARALAGRMGIPQTTKGRTKGTMQLKGLGEILSEENFRLHVEENIRLYLLTLLTDQRGLNLRNRVAHGMIEHNQMGRDLSDRLLHVLLMLASLDFEIAKD